MIHSNIAPRVYIKTDRTAHVRVCAGQLHLVRVLRARKVCVSSARIEKHLGLEFSGYIPATYG